MALRFNLSFQEDYMEITGSRALHLVCTTDEPASPKVLYSFDVTLYSTAKKYSKTWTGVQMPEGRTSVSIPFVPPMEWANDFAANIGDLAHEKACGLFQATMTAHYTGYAGTLVFEHDYTGYAAQIPGGVREDLLPTVGAVTAQAADGVVPPEWNIWVQGKSVARIAATQAAGTYGSSIISWQFGNGKPQDQPQADMLLTQSGAVTIPVTVTDSRLRRATADLLLEVQPYQPPSLSQISSFRCQPDGTPSENGTAFLPKFKLQFSDLNGRNIPRVICSWKKVTDTGYGRPLEPISGNAMEANLEDGASYDVKYTVSDEFHTIDYFDYISSTVYLLHFLKGGTGIAVGKAAEKSNLFDVGLDSSFRRDVTVGGDLAVVGGLRLGDTDVVTVLRDLNTLKTAQISCQNSLTNVTDNQAVKYGRLVLTRLVGVLNDRGGMPYVGVHYHVADLPTGYFNGKYLPIVFAAQNGTPCTGYVDEGGGLYVVPTQNGLQDTEVYTVGIV